MAWKADDRHGRRATFARGRDDSEGDDTMTNIGRWAAGMTAAVVLAVAGGCGGGTPAPQVAGPSKQQPEDAHPPEGPHGGPLAEWGNEEYHAEFTVDHKTKSVRVHILGPDAKKPTAIKADKVVLSVKKPAFRVELKPERQKDDPEGAASVFAAHDDRFGGEQEFEGTLSAEFGGKRYAGDFQEETDGHGHDHKK
jgi:hypothetical protein